MKLVFENQRLKVERGERFVKLKSQFILKLRNPNPKIEKLGIIFYSRRSASSSYEASTGTRVSVGEVLDFEYEGPTKFCHCHLKAPRWIAWTEKNVSRRFYSCVVSYEVSSV